MSMIRRYRHIRRYHEIGHVLARNGLGYLIELSGLGSLLPFTRFRSDSVCQVGAGLCMAARLRNALTELGPTFVKLGQMLSTRTDFLAPDFVEELEKLQDKVAPFPYEQVLEILTEEIGHPDQVFAGFNPEPLAAASIGQVHEAKLKTGERVIVKIQRPGIENQVQNDLEIMAALSAMIEQRSQQARQIGLTAIVQDYGKMLLRELDYDREAKNTERIRANFAGDRHVIIPQIHWEYTTGRVLTEEYIDGVKLSNISEIEQRGWDRSRLSKVGTEAFLSQILIHGFFQADPHQGNMLAVAEDKICFIDFGQMGSLTGRRLQNTGLLLLAITNQDMEKAMAVMQDMNLIPEELDSDGFQEDLADLLERIYSRAMGNINLGQLRTEILTLAFTHEIKLPSYLTALMKALVTVEGVGKKLDPNFNFVEVTQPLAERILAESMKPKRIWEEVRRTYFQDIRPLRTLPANFNKLIKSTADQRLLLGMRFELHSDERKEINRLINRLSGSIIIAGGLIGSASIIQAHHESVFQTYTMLGVLGFSFSLVAFLVFIVRNW